MPPSPDAVRFTHRECVGTTLRDHGALLAYLLRELLALRACAAALILRREEDRRIRGSAMTAKAPIPAIRKRFRCWQRSGHLRSKRPYFCQRGAWCHT